ncbi:MAG: hypothetical protein JO043_04000 [Candidatus Eremiobacteraeota bacterium]|nr:hypothetical protein [Candidatus Eremiobacteraeota bacterium]
MAVRLGLLWFAVPACVLGASLLGCQVPVVPPHPDASLTPVGRLWPGPTLFGAQTHIRRPNVPYLQRIAAAGFDAVRVSLTPWWAQSRHGGWMWTNYDAIYTWLIRHKMTPLFMLENPRSTDDLPAMEYFAERAAIRYPLALLELGNEPDSAAQWPGFYPPHARSAVTPEAYWAIVKRFALAWRKGNPHAIIGTAGTSGIDFPWQRGLIAAIEKDGAFRDGTIKAIGVHAYGEPFPYAGQRGGIVADLAELKTMLPRDVLVWVTEYGLPDPRPEDVHAWFDVMQRLGVPLFCWYEAQDDVLDGKTQPYGLIRLDGSPKPAYGAAKAFLLARSKTQ